MAPPVARSLPIEPAPHAPAAAPGGVGRRPRSGR